MTKVLPSTRVTAIPNRQPALRVAQHFVHRVSRRTVTTGRPNLPLTFVAKKLSNRVHQMTSRTRHAIFAHPFILELQEGTLPTEVFGFYLEQDDFYLHQCAKAHALLAARAAKHHARQLLEIAHSTLKIEQDCVHEFYRQQLDLKVVQTLTPAALGYTSYLIKTAAVDPVEVGVAAILPCFRIYHDVGRHISTHEASHNPYQRWIDTYSAEGFSDSVKTLTQLFDTLAEETTPLIRTQMAEAYARSSNWEWHFWNDAYCRCLMDQAEF